MHISQFLSYLILFLHCLILYYFDLILEVTDLYFPAKWREMYWMTLKECWLQYNTSDDRKLISRNSNKSSKYVHNKSQETE